MSHILLSSVIATPSPLLLNGIKFFGYYFEVSLLPPTIPKFTDEFQIHSSPLLDNYNSLLSPPTSSLASP